MPKGSESHSGTDVAIYARGPWAQLVDGTMEQNDIYHVMRYVSECPSEWFLKQVFEARLYSTAIARATKLRKRCFWSLTVLLLSNRQ